MAGIGEDNVQLVLCALQSVIKVQVKQVYDNCDDAQPNGTSSNGWNFVINLFMTFSQIVCGQGHSSSILVFILVKFFAISLNWLPCP